jgi:CAAX prenyl protease-like protein
MADMRLGLALSVSFVFVVLAYYYAVVGLAGAFWSRRLLRLASDHFSFSTGYATDELDKTVRLVVAALMQVLFCVGLVFLTGVPLAAMMWDPVDPVLLVFAVPLGIGEAAFGSFLGEVAMRAAMQLAPSRVPAETSAWLALLKGGWMNLFVRAAESAPLPLVISLTILYVGVEEIVFRGIALTVFAPLGPLAAFTLALGLFVSVQCFHMPSWESALFPVVGALVLGTVHGLLFLAVPQLLPLMVAHAVFLLVAIL